MADLSGQTLGKYQLIERLGRGGMADVYKGYHPRLERFVAVKTLHSHLIEASPDFLPRFEREAKAVATLRHPHIVQVYDFDLQGEVYYMVMELVDGGSLSEVLRELAQKGQRMPFARISELLQEIGSALDYAHQNHMLHRDIKPSNVLLDKAGHAYLADFGIARILGSGTHFTTTGTVIGTPHYMSPEQGRGEELTTASDVYALGVMLYEMLVGHVPYDAETPYGIIHKHINEPLPAAHLLRADLPAQAEAVLNKALAKEPLDRYQSAGELAATFHQVLGMVSARIPAATPGESLPVQPAKPSTGGAPTGARVETFSSPASIQPPAAARVAPVEALPPQVASVSSRAASASSANDLRSASAQHELKADSPVVQSDLPEFQSDQPSAAARTPHKRSRWLWLLILLPLLAVAGFLAFGAIRQQTLTQGCNTPETCLDQANRLAEQGNPVLSLPALNRAIDLVPANAHPGHAGLLCRRGDINLSIERFELAQRDFTLCIDWTEQDPALEDLRVYARERLLILR